MVPLRQSASATKQIANIAYLAFSQGNKPIDFWLCSQFYLHRRALVPLVKEKLTRRRRRGRAGRWRGVRREDGRRGAEHATEPREDS